MFFVWLCFEELVNEQLQTVQIYYRNNFWNCCVLNLDYKDLHIIRTIYKS
jgi:hypothetical protein